MSVNIRKLAFWLMDKLGGGKVRKHYLDLSNILENYGTDEVKSLLDGYLNETLQYACDNIDFYKKFKGYGSLADFPVVNKNIIRDNEVLFLNKAFDKDKLFKQETSGSTGMPFAVYQDPLKRARATADTLYFSKLAKYDLGQRLYFSRVWDSATTRSALTCLKQNWKIHDSSNLSEEKIETFISDL